MKVLLMLVMSVLVKAAFMGSIAHVAGRILLPDMGLGVPAWGKFFVVGVLVAIILEVVGFLEGLTE